MKKYRYPTEFKLNRMKYETKNDDTIKDHEKVY